jgi:hypothetical protein
MEAEHCHIRRRASWDLYRGTTAEALLKDYLAKPPSAEVHAQYRREITRRRRGQRRPPRTTKNTHCQRKPPGGFEPPHPECTERIYAVTRTHSLTEAYQVG